VKKKKCSWHGIFEAHERIEGPQVTITEKGDYRSTSLGAGVTEKTKYLNGLLYI